MHRLAAEVTRSPFQRRLALDQIGRAQLEGPRFRRLTRGLYLERGVTFATPEEAVIAKIAAFRKVLPESAVLCGLSAAWTLGVSLAGPRTPVEVISRQHVRCRTGLVVHRDELDPSEIVQTPFGPATGPVRTALDLARRARVPRAAGDHLMERLPPRLDDLRSTAIGPYPVVPDALGFRDPGLLAGQPVATVAARLALAVSWVDAVLRSTRTPVGDLAATVAARPATRGIRSARLVVLLADTRAESPPESRLRVRVALSELPMAEPQVPLRDARGRVIACTDLGFHAFELGAEYDGAYHREFDRALRDLARDNAAHRSSWGLVHFDDASMRDPLQLLRTLHASLARRRTA